MDRAAAIALALAIPFLALAFYVGTRALPPFWGFGAALAFYWTFVLIPLIIWRRGFHKARFDVTMPAKWLTIASIVPIVAVAGVATIAVLQDPLPLYILATVALAAVLNGTLEEVFWRGTLLQDNASRNEQIGQIMLFTGWHVALLFAAGVVVTGGPAGLLGGAAMAGVLWTLARMQTGSIGFGILCHIGLNLFAFTELASKNLV